MRLRRKAAVPAKGLVWCERQSEVCGGPRRGHEVLEEIKLNALERGWRI